MTNENKFVVIVRKRQDWRTNGPMLFKLEKKTPKCVFVRGINQTYGVTTRFSDAEFNWAIFDTEEAARASIPADLLGLKQAENDAENAWRNARDAFRTACDEYAETLKG